MDDYIYRTDRIKDLRRVDDGYFRAKIRPDGEYDYAHRVLEAPAARCPRGQSVFRICFWSTLQHAKKSLDTVYAPHWGDGIISRLYRSDLRDQGFFETWDDGFKEGDAYLFWKHDFPIGRSQSLSASAISTDRIDVLETGQWVPFETLIDHRPAKSSPEPEASECKMQASTHNPAGRHADRSLIARLLAQIWPYG